ncbi:MAG: hypothetical protein ABI903_13890 [Actinomycetota bacterium]
MTLSTTHSLHLATGRISVAVRYCVVLVCAASAGVHAALVPDPEQLDLLGLATSAAEVLAALSAALLITRKEPR